ncbi:MAG TPA: hypothetical protein DDZ81_13540 [Acetobacteraceae bacterium]|nr:hypothetical protein [Acetobacteraceae bacterium]
MTVSTGRASIEAAISKRHLSGPAGSVCGQRDRVSGVLAAAGDRGGLERGNALARWFARPQIGAQSWGTIQ